MDKHTLRLLTDAVGFPESPRWRGNCLWFSDVHNFRLKACDANGSPVMDIAVPERPAGLGFMPDGRLLMATALGRRLYWVDGDRLSLAADLSQACRGLLNDMVVDGAGRAYVGDTGFDLGAGEDPRPGQLFMFDENGAVRTVYDDVTFPNGIAISPDATTLYLAESFAKRISAFQIKPDGSLGPRVNHADIDGVPDGLCLDAEGCLWVGDFTGGRFLRVGTNGKVLDVVESGMAHGIACMLGGPDRKLLVVCSATKDDNGVYAGKIEVMETPSQGCGWP